MNFQELIVSAVVFGAIYFLGNKFFRKKENTACGCGDNGKCKKHNDSVKKNS